METIAPHPTWPQDAQEAVRRWRCEQLERAGYGAPFALLLSSDDRVDLHRAVDLITRGCPEILALRILL